ncbi:MAG: hypothetical protein NVSMB43_04010 [Pseudarthrobacter sp.]
MDTSPEAFSSAPFLINFHAQDLAGLLTATAGESSTNGFGIFAPGLIHPYLRGYPEIGAPVGTA